MERIIALFRILFLALIASLFIFRQQFWFQEALVRYWFWLFMGSLLLSRWYIHKLVTQKSFISFCSLTILAFGMFPAVKALVAFELESTVQQGANGSLHVSIRNTCLDKDSDESPCPFSTQHGCVTLCSQFPITPLKESAYGDDLPPISLVSIEIPKNDPVNVLLVDFAPTSDQDLWFARRLALRRASTDVRHSRKRWFVVGDFGSGILGRTYEGFLEASKMEDGALRNTPKLSPAPTMHLLFKGSMQVRESLRRGSSLFLTFDLLPDSVELR